MTCSGFLGQLQIIKAFMNKILCTLIALCAWTAAAQNLIQLSADVNGANAIPPNDLPWHPAVSISFGTRFVGGGPQPPGSPPKGVLTSNTLLITVGFTSANLSSHAVTPGMLTISSDTGQVITNLLAIPPNPGILGDAPGCALCSGPSYSTFLILNNSQAQELLAGHWIITIAANGNGGIPVLGLAIRGRILPLDSDHDGIPDYKDQCPNTPPGEAVNEHGCSIEQLCPCEGGWKNHGEYVNCIKATTERFVAAKLITETDRRTIMQQAETSHCGQSR
jgi:hypothetical protein